MKNLFFLLLLFFSVPSLKAQLSVSGGLGINYCTMPSFSDHINSLVSEKLADGAAHVEYFLSGAFPVSQRFETALEFSSDIYSYNSSSSFYTLDYTAYKPSVLFFYVFTGNGFQLKAGGGAGPRFCTVDETLVSVVPNTYTSTGIGFILRAEGNTALGSDLYAHIALSMNADYCGNIRSVTGEKINLKSYSAGLRLGMTYIF